jgi:hypothetical protein
MFSKSQIATLLLTRREKKEVITMMDAQLSFAKPLFLGGGGAGPLASLGWETCCNGKYMYGYSTCCNDKPPPEV